MVWNEILNIERNFKHAGYSIKKHMKQFYKKIFGALLKRLC